MNQIAAKEILAKEIGVPSADIEILDVDLDVDLGRKKSWWVTYALHADIEPHVYSTFVFTSVPNMSTRSVTDFEFAGATEDGYPLRLFFWPSENRAAVRISREQVKAKHPRPGQVLELTAGPVEGMTVVLGPNLGDGWWALKEVRDSVGKPS